MEKERIPFFIISVGVIVNFSTNYLFVQYLDYGLFGSNLALLFTNFTCFILSILIPSFYLPDIKDSWFLLNRDMLKGLKDYLRVAIPCML